MSGELNPSVKVYIGEDRSASYKCPARKHTKNPIWESPYEFLCTDKTSSKLVIRVIDNRDFSKDLEVGYMAITLTDLLACTGQAGKDWFQLSNCKSGKIRISAEWKPLNMAGALQAAEKRKQLIDVVRLHDRGDNKADKSAVVHEEPHRLCPASDPAGPTRSFRALGSPPQPHARGPRPVGPHARRPRMVCPPFTVPSYILNPFFSPPPCLFQTRTPPLPMLL